MSTRWVEGKRKCRNVRSHQDTIFLHSKDCCQFLRLLCLTDRCAVLPADRSPRFCQRTDEFPLYSRRPSCDTMALAMCDPGLRRRDSSECEEDSLPEVYMDSGLSTLRGSHAGYDSEQEVSRGQEEEEAEEERAKVQMEANSLSSTMGENSDTEVRRRSAGTWRSTVASLIDTMTADAFTIIHCGHIHGWVWNPVPCLTFLREFHCEQESALHHMNPRRSEFPA